MKNLSTFPIILSFLLLLGCKKEDECIEYKTSSVLAIQAPANAKANEPVEFILNVKQSDGCGEFDRYVTKRLGSNIYVNVVARHTGCNCNATSEITKQTIELYFPYRNKNSAVHFLSEEPDTYITHYIRINE